MLCVPSVFSASLGLCVHLSACRCLSAEAVCSMSIPSSECVLPVHTSLSLCFIWHSLMAHLERMANNISPQTSPLPAEAFHSHIFFPDFHAHLPQGEGHIKQTYK